MAPTHTCQHYTRYRTSPHARSAPILIPYDLPPQIRLPLILRNDDTTPGIVHTRTGPVASITEYIPIHVSKAPKPSEARFQSFKPARLGVTAPPGLGPQPPPRKDVQIVPHRLPAAENVRRRNQLAWRQEQSFKEQRVKQVALTSNERMRILDQRRVMEAAQNARDREHIREERKMREAAQKIVGEGAAYDEEAAGGWVEGMSGSETDVAVSV